MKRVWSAASAASRLAGGLLVFSAFLFGGFLFGGSARAGGLGPGDARYSHYDASGLLTPARSKCMAPSELSKQMHRSGWFDIHRISEGPDRIVMTAKQHGGLIYRMVIARCTGDLVEARLLNGAAHGDGRDGRQVAYHEPRPVPYLDADVDIAPRPSYGDAPPYYYGYGRAYSYAGAPYGYGYRAPYPYSPAPGY